MTVSKALAAVLCAAVLTACTSQIPAATPPAAVEPRVSPDFDGDGLADLAFTDSHFPFVYDLRVRYGPGRLEVFTPLQVTGEVDGNLDGRPLAADLNRDGYSDLALVASNTRGPAKTSNLYLLFGSAAGLQLQNMRVIPPPESLGQPFASALALVAEPVPRLVVSYGDHWDGGIGLAAFRLGDDGEPVGPPLLLAEGLGGVPELPAVSGSSDFGGALASLGDHLIVAASGTAVSGSAFAGAIVDLTLGEAGVLAARVIDLASDGVPGDPQQDARFGTSLAAGDGYLAVGIAGDHTGGDTYGSVQVFTLADGALVPSQRITPPAGGAAIGGSFGRTVAIGRVCADTLGVVVGQPGARVPDAGEDGPGGAAWVVPLTPTADCPVRQLVEGAGLPGPAAPSREIGSAVGTLRTAGAVDTLVITGEGNGCLSQDPGRVFLMADGRATVSLDESPRALAGS